MLCRYRNIFGKPGRGFHSFRMRDIAMNDVIGTVAVSCFISLYCRWAFWKVLSAALLAGVGFHRLFCVNTTVNKWIFGEV